jgi:hypothetical protein
MFNIVSALLVNTNKIIIMNKFATELNGQCHKVVSEIFNIEKMNKYFCKYGITLFDTCDIDFKIHTVLHDGLDITDEIKNKFNSHNRLRIPKETNYKNLTIDYSINDHTFRETYDECLTEDIKFDLYENYYRRIAWINETDKTMFDDILKNICFHDRFHTIKNDFLQTIDDGASINVFHLRVEADALGHWSCQNKMSVEEFKKYLEQKYIGLIEKYIQKSDENIIVSYSTDNPVLDYMKTNGYKYRCTEKTQPGRELNAIVDLLISTACNNVFIGNFNLKSLNGSSFSYYISTLLDTKVKRIMIDLDRIRNEEQLT